MLLFFSLMAHILCEIRQLWCAIVLIPCIIPLCWSKGTKGNDEERGKGGVKEGVCGYGAKGGKAHLPTNTQRRKAAFVMMIMRKIMIDLRLSSQLSSRRLPSRLHSVCVSRARASSASPNARGVFRLRKRLPCNEHYGIVMLQFNSPHSRQGTVR